MKETGENLEKLKDQLCKEWCSRNEIIYDFKKLFDQENQNNETRKKPSIKK